ncbi:MAG: hypothetical protein JNN01_11040 [Opitutaceae bacterium]|nr:hypothetical protein [Opitutaceae bacterium]
MKFILTLLTLVVLTLGSGCASNQNAAITPGTNLGALKKFYVVRLPADTRGINQLIADEFSRRGFEASTGEVINAPAGVDAVVTYQDKWMWDLTMYMIRLDIQLRKPQNDVPMAIGSSLRTSLVRKSPPEMVKEVLDQIYSDPKAKTPSPAMGTK